MCLGPDHAGMIVKEASYEVSEPTVDSQMVTLQGSGADVLLYRRVAEVRRPGNPEVLRPRLEPGALLVERLAIDRDRV